MRAVDLVAVEQSPRTDLPVICTAAAARDAHTHSELSSLPTYRVLIMICVVALACAG